MIGKNEFYVLTRDPDSGEVKWHLTKGVKVKIVPDMVTFAHKARDGWCVVELLTGHRITFNPWPTKREAVAEAAALLLWYDNYLEVRDSIVAKRGLAPYPELIASTVG